jgi:predicted amidohydrolase
MRDIRVACGQFAPEAGATGRNVARMIALAGEARAEGCEIIVFPELITTGYLAPDLIPPLAEPLSGPTVAALADAARDLGIAIAFGMAERVGDACYNSMVALGAQGGVVGVYHKVHLWDTERLWAEPGVDMPTFDLGGAVCAGWICYDTRFPELARLAALRGAKVGLISTAWLGPGDEWRLAVRARALDNGMFVAGSDIISYDPTLRCYGRSLIVDPHGAVLAESEPEQEGIIWAELEAASQEAQRGRVPLLEHRRPTLYRRLEGPGS